MRFGDHCYQKASDVDDSILANADACIAKGSNLWYPETSEEMTFVAANFPSSSNT
jgi:hypothetical protein